MAGEKGVPGARTKERLDAIRPCLPATGRVYLPRGHRSGVAMKAELTVTIDEELIPRAERLARERGISVSELVETSLRTVTEHPEGSFSQRWRGQFKPADRDDERYSILAKRFL